MTEERCCPVDGSDLRITWTAKVAAWAPKAPYRASFTEVTTSGVCRSAITKDILKCFITMCQRPKKFYFKTSWCT